MSQRPGTDEDKLVRGLGLLDSTMLVAGSMIGSGIFIVSSIIARQVGAPGWLLVVWVVTGLLTLMAALSYGELAAMMPKAGGQYVYLREAFSPLWGFLYGWTLFLVIQTGTIAAVAVGFARYMGVLVPWVSESNYLRSEEHTSELQSRQYLVCRLLLEKKKTCRSARRRSTRRPASTVSTTGSVDRKSTRLNSSNAYTSYAVFCLKRTIQR